VRQDLGDERAEQAARQHAWQDAAEQREVVGQDFQHAVDAVAPPDQRGAHRDQRRDHDHRPADRLADVSGTRPGFRGVVGRRRIF
jgi:hypothetical protein